MDTNKEKVKKTVGKVKKKKIVKKEITDLNGNVIKKNTEEKIKKKKSLKSHFKKYKKLYLLILAILISITVIVLGYIGIRNYMLSKKYGKYEKKMTDYGFSLMYTNQKPTSYDKVTKVEMIKMIIASIYNTADLSDRGFTSYGKYEGDEWVRFAEATEIIEQGYITKDNYDETATYKEALTLYIEARSRLLDLPVSSKTESSFKNLNAYTQQERTYINDAVENGIIENSKKKITLDKDLFKGEFNMLVVKFIEKYNTVAPEGETLVTKEESKPKNADMYPYIIYSIPNEVYEYKGINENEVDYASPVETYKYKKDYYDQVEYRAEYYYNQLLNINYENINVDKYLEDTIKYLRYDYTEQIKEYVNYVKENKIILEGEAKVQLPIFYLDGIRYRSRIKLSFEIKNSNTDKNVLLGDLGRSTEVTYKNKKYELYIDAPMGRTLLSKSLLLDMEPIIDLIVNNTEASAKNEI